MTSSRVCLYLLNIYHFTYTFSHAHTEAHTHKHTCTISTQEEWRQPGTGAWSEGQKKGFVRDHAHTHKKKQKKKCQKKPIFTNPKKRFEHIELPAKLLDYFLRSNKSNINQSSHTRSSYPGMPNSMACTSPCLLLSAAVVATLRLMRTLNPLLRASCADTFMS